MGHHCGGLTNEQSGFTRRSRLSAAWKGWCWRTRRWAEGPAERSACKTAEGLLLPARPGDTKGIKRKPMTYSFRVIYIERSKENSIVHSTQSAKIAVKCPVSISWKLFESLQYNHDDKIGEGTEVHSPNWRLHTYFISLPNFNKSCKFCFQVSRLDENAGLKFL